MGVEAIWSFLHIFQSFVEISNVRERNQQIDNKVQFDSRRVHSKNNLHGLDSAEISEREKWKHMEISSELTINWTTIICPSFPSHIGIADTVLGKRIKSLRFLLDV